MKPIDIDKTGISFIRQQTPQSEIKTTREESPSGFVSKSKGEQLIDLLSLVKNPPYTATENTEKFERIKSEVRSNAYSIDFNKLVYNLLASDI